MTQHDKWTSRDIAEHTRLQSVQDMARNMTAQTCKHPPRKRSRWTPFARFMIDLCAFLVAGFVLALVTGFVLALVTT